MKLNYLYIQKTKYRIEPRSDKVKVFSINDFMPAGQFTLNSLDYNENKVPGQFEFKAEDDNYIYAICNPDIKVTEDIHLVIDGEFAIFDSTKYPYKPDNLSLEFNSKKLA